MRADPISGASAAVPALLTKALIRRLYIPIGERTLDRWVAMGRFPRPDISLGGKSRLWKRETIETWINAHARGEGRDEE